MYWEAVVGWYFVCAWAVGVEEVAGASRVGVCGVVWWCSQVMLETVGVVNKFVVYVNIPTVTR